MLQRKLLLTIGLVLLQASVSSLEHLRSYLLQDGSSNVAAISIYEGSLLLTASSDIVQKDLNTGAIKRTFRAHSGQVNAFMVISDNKMISSGWDDMIIMWDLVTGSVIKRIWLGSLDTRVEVVVLHNDYLYAGGSDKRIRKVDKITGKIFVFEQNVPVNTMVVQDDFLIVSLRRVDNLVKIDSTTGAYMHSFIGHPNSVFALQLRENYLFSGSADTNIICWNPLNGDKLRTLTGHSDEVHTLLLVDNILYSGGSDFKIIKWDIESWQIIQELPNAHTNIIRCLAHSDGLLLSGSNDATVIKWNATSGNRMFTFRGLSKKLWSVVFWNNFVITGGDDSSILVWDASANYLAPTAFMLAHVGPVNCLFVYKNSLFSGSSDRLILQWNLLTLLQEKSFHGHAKSVIAIIADDLKLYSGSNDLSVRIWSISSGITEHELTGHTNSVSSLQMNENYIYSSSFDKTIKEWSRTLLQNTKTITYHSTLFSILLFENSIVAGSYGIVRFDITTGSALGSERETISCITIVAKRELLYSGHADSTIRVRDFSSLSVLETYQGHLDGVVALDFDTAGNLYSASFDGSAKKWNMLSRRVAFSFENRNASVTSLVAFGDVLFVGNKNGAMNAFEIHGAMLQLSLNLHRKAVSSLLVYNNNLYSAGMDGLILKYALDNGMGNTVVSESDSSSYHSLIHLKQGIAVVNGNFEILLFYLNRSQDSTKTITSSVPIVCISASEKHIMAGTKVGTILGWDLITLQSSFTLKKHTSQINALLLNEDSLFSASDDKTIIHWSLESKQVVQELKRYSTRALGHLGPVSCLAICYTVLFSGGLDTTTRRWNIQTGVHEEAYFGPSKAVTAITCHNQSLFVGSDDFSVFMFKPIFPEIDAAPMTTSTGFLKTQRKILKKIQTASMRNEKNVQNLIMIVGVLVVAVISVIAAVYSFRYTKFVHSHQVETKMSTNDASSSVVTNMETVVNSIMGISKHAAYLLHPEMILPVKKIAVGGGGELYLAKLMDQGLIKKDGEFVIQKVVFIKNKASTEAFYQEVGIMIMLGTFSNFCRIIGYTEKPFAMILKYYPAGSLYEWRRQNKINQKVLLKIVTDIAHALRVMHTHYLAHCDIKTQNVLIEYVNERPDCFLTDFGITKILSDRIVSSKLFKIINLRGLSVHYASPEAFNYFKRQSLERIDFEKFDIYSWASVIYEVANGRSPWN